MKVNEVLHENAYLTALGTRLSAMGLHDAIATGLQDSRLRVVAKDWLSKWNNKLQKFKTLPQQNVLTSLLQELVYTEMKVNPNEVSDKAIQQLVDLTSTQSNTGIALKYMTKLMALSLLQPSEEKQIIEYGDYLPDTMLRPGKIVPVKYVLATDSTNWVKFNGEWHKDMDESDLRVTLHDTPVEDTQKLDNMYGRNVPMRVGQTGTRTLEFLHRSETQEWFNEYE
jgi:hypothetical protein